MLAEQNPEPVRFGMVTNGESFIFLKLRVGEIPSYTRSPVFLLAQDAGLERTLQVMKRLGEASGS